jgi:predicted DNA-binding transcriptional regulator YafY
MKKINGIIAGFIQYNVISSILQKFLDEMTTAFKGLSEYEFSEKMWEIGQAVQETRYIEMDYLRTKDKTVVNRKVQPVAILFSEYYFYLMAFIDDEAVRKNFDALNDFFPTIYRIDRIKSLKILDERFHIPYSS